MSANPQLSQVPGHGLIPLPFEAEHLLLSRQVEFYLDGVRTQSGSWSARGHLFLSSLRLVLVADKEDSSGASAYEGTSWSPGHACQPCLREGAASHCCLTTGSDYLVFELGLYPVCLCFPVGHFYGL